MDYSQKATLRLPFNFERKTRLEPATRATREHLITPSAAGRRPPMSVELGKYINDVLPTKRAPIPFFYIKIAGATLSLGASASTVDVLVAQAGVQNAVGFTDGSFLLHKEEVAGSKSHLALCLLNQEGFSGSG